VLESILRWAFVIPGSLLAAFAATFPWHWIVLLIANFGGRREGEETLGFGLLVRVVGPETIERLGYGFITTFVIITAAALIAPKFKLLTGRIAALLVGVVQITVFIFTINSPDTYFKSPTSGAIGWLYPIVLISLWLLGLLAALRCVKGLANDELRNDVDEPDQA